jgi:hypothetical protein
MYSRRQCGLCDEAREIILKVRERTAFDFDEVFIDGHDDLDQTYGLRVPVVEVNGEEHFEYLVDPTTLQRLVAESE